MFTGIIEEIGRVAAIRFKGDHAQVEIDCREVLDDLTPGASVCVNGSCLTVTQLHGKGFSADLSAETLKRTTFRFLSVGSSLNLERSLSLQSRLGGHLVNGHVDGIGKVLSMPPCAGAGEWVFSLPEQLERYVVEKGSITVDGISLTVASLTEGRFSVAIIPATVIQTNLHDRKTGDFVNLEVDILAKYVEKLIAAKKGDHHEATLNEALIRYGYLAGDASS